MQQGETGGAWPNCQLSDFFCKELTNAASPGPPFSRIRRLVFSTSLTEFGTAASLHRKFPRRSRAQDARRLGENFRAGVSRAVRILRREDLGLFAGTAGVRIIL